MAVLADGLANQRSAKLEVVATMSVGEQAVVANAYEAGRQDVQEETANQLVGIELEDALLSAGGAVFVVIME